ncbi:histone-lysine N-methyltransferase SETMAR [Trichonephila clavipes]|nr:histone-lysine N-methyltransferase SETMAR [Trichonephila clavipes]
MDVSKELVRGCLFYDIKEDLSVAASSHRICQSFRDSAVNELTARLHVAWVARNTIQRLGWEALCHPLYSPDVAPSDYHLFHSLDNHLRGKSFTNEEDVRQALTDFFASHTPEFYRKGIDQLKTHWRKVLVADGGYFEE